MRRRVDLDPAADHDIEEQFGYLAGRSLDAALRFLEATRETFELLAEMPGIGTVRKYRKRDLADIRMSPIRGFENSLTFYLTHEDSIRILRVIHGARDIERIFGGSVSPDSNQSE